MARTGADSRRKHRRIVLGSVEQLADEVVALQAISALRLELRVAQDEIDDSLRPCVIVGPQRLFSERFGNAV
jgi:hypothetical protein